MVMVWRQELFLQLLDGDSSETLCAFHRLGGFLFQSSLRMTWSCVSVLIAREKMDGVL